MKKKLIVACLLLMSMILSSACAFSAYINQEPTEEVVNEQTLPKVEKMTPVTVKGEFAAHVIDIIPDYVLDDETPRIPLIACYQTEPFLLKVPDSILANLNVDKNYRFIIEEKALDGDALELYYGNETFIENLSLHEQILLFDLVIASVEELEENGIGVSENRITFER